MVECHKGMSLSTGAGLRSPRSVLSVAVFFLLYIVRRLKNERFAFLLFCKILSGYTLS